LAYLVTLESTRTSHPLRTNPQKCNFLSKRDRQCLFNDTGNISPPRQQQHRRPRFSFHHSIVKQQRDKTLNPNKTNSPVQAPIRSRDLSVTTRTKKTAPAAHRPRSEIHIPNTPKTSQQQKWNFSTFRCRRIEGPISGAPEPGRCPCFRRYGPSETNPVPGYADRPAPPVNRTGCARRQPHPCGVSAVGLKTRTRKNMR
jgi:hypothetical protein